MHEVAILDARIPAMLKDLTDQSHSAEHACVYDYSDAF